MPYDGDWRHEFGPNIHGTTLSFVPDASPRDVPVHTFIGAAEDPAFTVQNRDHWQPRDMTMTQWMAEGTLANLTEDELLELAGVDDFWQAMHRLGGAAERAEEPWTRDRLMIQGRAAPVDSVVAEVGGLRLVVADLGERMVSVVERTAAGSPELWGLVAIDDRGLA